MRKDKKIIYMVLIIGLIGVFGGIVAQNNLLSGNWFFINRHLINVFGYLIFIGSGFIFVFNRVRTTMLSAIGLCSIIGFLFAGLGKYLYDNSIWLDTIIIAPNTIEDAMIIITLFWIVIGILIGASRN